MSRRKRRDAQKNDFLLFPFFLRDIKIHILWFMKTIHAENAEMRRKMISFISVFSA